MASTGFRAKASALSRRVIGEVLAQHPTPRTEAELHALFRGPMRKAYPYPTRRSWWAYRIWLDELERARNRFRPDVYGPPIAIGCPVCPAKAWRMCFLAYGDAAPLMDRSMDLVRTAIRDADERGELVPPKLRLQAFHNQRVDRYYRRTGEGPTLPLFGEAIAHG